MQMKKIKEENGSISVYVFLVLFSFLIVLTSFYVSASTVRKSELATVLRIKQSYEQDNKNVEEIYQKRLKLTKAGTGMKEKPSSWTSENVTAISDGNGGTIPLPSEFYYVGGDIKSGIVISDSSEDENKGDSYEVAKTLKGNQFVWIPVSSEANLERTNFDSNGNPTTSAPRTGRDVADCTEPMENGYSTEVSEYNKMRAQVLQYGGFYIGRYEAGDGTNGTTLRTAATAIHTVVSKANVAPYNFVPWGKSMTDSSAIEGQGGAVYLAKNMYVSSESVASTLIYGCQWDAMCRYIGDSQRTTSTKAAPELTGNVKSDVSKNIYDLAGNCWEWTMESNKNDSRVIKGGRYGDEFNVSHRDYVITTGYDSYGSFRCALYIK